MSLKGFEKSFIIYLVLSSLTESLQPTPPDILCAIRNKAGNFAVQQQLYNQDIFGFATREAYGWLCCHSHRWAFTPPFHPFLYARRHAGGYFLLCYYPLSKIFPLGSTVPYVARTFLSRFIPEAIKQPAGCKNNTFIFIR